MSKRLLCLALVAVLIAGCAATRLPSTGFAEPAALERAMNRYYEAHASEQYGYCLKPYIDGLTQVAVVDSQPERLVVDVRYFYRDRLKDDRGQDGFGRECTGYAGRSFTFGKGAAGVEVLDMTGPRRS
jgi:hypothetical protein